MSHHGPWLATFLAGREVGPARGGCIGVFVESDSFNRAEWEAMRAIADALPEEDVGRGLGAA